MNKKTRGPADFKADYQLLEIDDRADWKTARASYRRLVHLWHPDRYTQRPRERDHAQRQFIALTKSYNNLRTFHRTNGHLPFEPVKLKEPSPQISTKAKKQRKDQSAETAQDHFDQASVDSGILGRDASMRSPETTAKRKPSKTLWIASAAMLLAVTMSTFFILDRRSHQKIVETGREVIRQTPPSEFMPSAAEIRKSEARGAFVRQTR